MWNTLFSFMQVVVCFCFLAIIIGLLMCCIAFVGSGNFSPWSWEAEARGVWMFISLAASAILTAIFACDGI